MSERAGEILISEIKNNPDSVIGFATGSTPLGLYKILIRAYKNKNISFSRITTFNLDEYYPIKKADKNSYYSYMFHNLFRHVNIKKSSINLLDGGARDSEKECRDYEKRLGKKRIDVQILGVGVNGHIGFNEPGSKLDSRTRLVKLDSETIRSNSRFFKNKLVPKSALTMGISSIMNAKKIILLASGKEKAEAIKHLVEGEEDEKWPVSLLKRHKNLVVVIDKEAASLLKD